MQQQHLIQMQPMMAAYYPTNVTTDHIQQYLDENKSLILKIVENQNSGKMSECAENQAKLQRNLMYLAAIADSQPQPPNIHSQYAAGGILQPGMHYQLQQHQQAQAAQAHMTPQSLMAAAGSSMLYGAQPYPSLQQQALHNQLSMSSGGGMMLQGKPHGAGGSSHPGIDGSGGGGFPDFIRSSNSGQGDNLQSNMRAMQASGSKQDMGSNASGEGRDGGETLYLKSADDGN